MLEEQYRELNELRTYLKSKEIIDNTVNQIMDKLLDLNQTVKLIANNEERRHIKGKAFV